MTNGKKKKVNREKIIESGKEWIRQKKVRFLLLVKETAFWQLQTLNGVMFVKYLANKAAWLFFLLLFSCVAESTVREAAVLTEHEYASYSILGTMIVFPILFRIAISMGVYFKTDNPRSLLKPLGMILLSVVSVTIIPILESKGQTLSELTEMFVDRLLISLVIWFMCTMIVSLSVRRIATKIGWFRLETKRGEGVRIRYSTNYQLTKKWAPYVVPLEIREEYRGMDPKKGLTGKIETVHSLHFRLRYTRLSGATHRLSGFYEGDSHCSTEELPSLGKLIETERQEAAQELQGLRATLDDQKESGKGGTEEC